MLEIGTMLSSRVRFRCKLLESQGYPENFIIEVKSDRVIDCNIYRMANDDNGNRLLWVNIKALKKGAPTVVELCMKKTGRSDSTKASLTNAVTYGAQIANASLEGDLSFR